MKFVVDKMMVASLLAASTMVASAHPSMDVLAKFAPEFRCPYANEWVTKGPEQAAIDLGLVNSTNYSVKGSVRRTEEAGVPPGSEGGGFPFTVEAPSEPVACAIAPGAIGAGHQDGFSTGYSPNCEGTPAEGSPYMWPMAWKADTESQSMPFGTDEIIYHSKGIAYYRLDKNWKRADTYFQRGVQRSIGQSPCPPENDVSGEGGIIRACERNSDEYKTMIHRGGKMMFISWKNGTEVGSSDPNQIEDCNWLDLAVVGNIRNDWYMDARGDSTGVQYLGNQHVFHDGIPRLVKQWRKKDFASQYFVMSVLENVGRDGIHWPMMINVPGEGFGDDHIRVYRNQSLLTEDDDHLFWLDEALESIGGKCEKMERGSGDGVGPPKQEVLIPSNLEVDPNSWFENVYTYSPVWKPPVEEEKQSMATGSSGMATTQEGDITAKSCYDPTKRVVKLGVKYSNVEMIGSELPWMALGFRPTDECVMTPRDGGNTELIMLSKDTPDGEVGAHHTSLPPLAKSLDKDALSSIYTNMVPLQDMDGFSNVELHLPTTSSVSKSAHDGDEDSIMLQFHQSMPEAPEVMHLMYAVGSQPEIGYHRTRKCFEITEFPTCPTTPTASEEAEGEPMATMLESSSAPRSTLFVAVVGTLMAMLL